MCKTYFFKHTLFSQILIVSVLSQPAVLAPIFYYYYFFIFFHKLGDGEMKYEIMRVSQTHVIKQITIWDVVDLFQKKNKNKIWLKIFNLFIQQ